MMRRSRDRFTALASITFFAASMFLAGIVRTQEAGADSAVDELVDRAADLRDMARFGGDFATAVYAAREVARIDPEDHANRLLLAELLVRLGKDDEASATLAALRKDVGDDPKASYLGVFIAQRRDRADEAARLRDDLARAAQGDPHRMLGAADYMHALGMDDQAAHALRSIIAGALREDSVDVIQARLGLGQLLLEKGDWAGARDVVAPLEAGPAGVDETLEVPVGHDAASRSSSRSAFSGAFQTAAGTGRTFDDVEVAARAVEARSALQRGRPEHAARLAEPLVAQDPKDVEAAIVLVRALRALGRIDEAERYIRRTSAVLRVALDDNALEGSPYNTLAWFYASVDEKLDEAAALAERALSLSSLNPAYLDTLAEVQYRRGDSVRAAQLAEKAMGTFIGRPYYYAGQLARFRRGQ